MGHQPSRSKAVCILVGAAEASRQLTACLALLRWMQHSSLRYSGCTSRIAGFDMVMVALYAALGACALSGSFITRREGFPVPQNIRTSSITSTDEAIEMAELIILTVAIMNLASSFHPSPEIASDRNNLRQSLGKHTIRLRAPSERQAHPSAKSHECSPTQAARTDDRRC
jgi:hypothetical protein